MDYKNKYLKYKEKYLKLKYKSKGGSFLLSLLSSKNKIESPTLEQQYIDYIEDNFDSKIYKLMISDDGYQSFNITELKEYFDSDENGEEYVNSDERFEKFTIPQIIFFEKIIRLFKSDFDLQLHLGDYIIHKYGLKFKFNGTSILQTKYIRLLQSPLIINGKINEKILEFDENKNPYHRYIDYHYNSIKESMIEIYKIRPYGEKSYIIYLFKNLKKFFSNERANIDKKDFDLLVKILEKHTYLINFLKRLKIND